DLAEDGGQEDEVERAGAERQSRRITANEWRRGGSQAGPQSVKGRELKIERNHPAARANALDRRAGEIPAGRPDLEDEHARDEPVPVGRDLGAEVAPPVRGVERRIEEPGHRPGKDAPPHHDGQEYPDAPRYPGENVPHSAADQLPRDGELLDLRRPPAQLHQLRVPGEALHLVLL